MRHIRSQTVMWNGEKTIINVNIKRIVQEAADQFYKSVQEEWYVSLLHNRIISTSRQSRLDSHGNIKLH